ncbi:MAG: peptide-methionine (S)-S-oxide reductase MsrA [Steroidobacteraceae bacterium]
MSVSKFLCGGLAPALLLGVLASVGACVAAEAPVAIPPPAVDNPREHGALQTAVLAGGCFWGVQGVFEHVRGVHEVLAGYAGGAGATASYEEVSSGSTGHAESVRIVFDPAEVSYGKLLQIYFSVAHNPTELNRQGPDSGTQYRSSIFYGDDGQRHIAEGYIAQLDKGKAFPQPIVTRLDPLRGFYRAEDYHQDYYLRNPHSPYIVINDLPKIANLKALFPDYYQESPARAP